jgi:hypothetical protein
MKLARTVAALLFLSGLTTFAWAAGFKPQTLAGLPWTEIILIALPVFGTAMFRHLPVRR